MPEGPASNATGQFTDHQVAELAKRGISPDQAAAAGVLAITTEAELRPGMPDYWTVAGGYLPAMAFPWRSLSPDVDVQWQLKPDTPQLDEEGRARKYVFAKGFRPVLNPIRTVPGSDRVLVVEGTHQAIAAGLNAPEGWSVLGIAGCRGWSTEGLPINDLLGLAGTTVVVVLDADMARNLQVWEAGQALARELEMSGAASVRFAQVTGGAKSGLDDVLGARPAAARREYVERLIAPGRTLEPAKVRRPSRDVASQAEKADKALARKEADAAELAREKAAGRVRVDVSRDKLEVVNDLLGEIRKWGDGRGLFNRGGLLVRRHGDGLSVLGRATLTDVITQSVRTGAPGLGGSWADCWPDGSTMDNILARWRDFAELDQIVAAPFVRTDGTICQTNGYDRSSKTFLRMARGMAERLTVPEEPSREDVQAAVKLLLDDWLGDFPFPTEADRAHVLAWMLTPFIRGQVDVVPIAVIDGNGPSAGKGLLAELFCRLVLGSPFEPTTLPGDNDEARKAITSAFLDGSSVLIWDEAHTLEGTSLAQLLTAPVWRDRKLGGNEMARVPNRLTLAALGNNVQVNGDIGRRAYRIRVHPAMERPEDRPASSFRHPDIKAWTEEHRAELLSAVLVLIRAWHVADRPSGPDTFGSFEKWSRTVGGILLHAGVPGFLEGRREWLEYSNESTDMWGMHLAWLADTFSDRPFRASEAGAQLARAGANAHLPSAARGLASPEGTAAYATSLGQAYRHRVGQTYDGLMLVRAARDGGYAYWRVVQDGDKTDMGTFQPPTEAVTQETDKTTSYREGSGNVDKTTSSRGVEGGSRGSHTHVHEVYQNEVDHAFLQNRYIGGMATPTTPTTPPDHLQTPSVEVLADPDQYLIGQPYESRDEAGHVEILVDGLWYACPICHPATARVDQVQSPDPDPFAD